VLQSSSPTIFSAGLDLVEMNRPDPDRLVAFWRSFQQLYLDLYGSRLACVAAIEGHAPAAGCMLALSCDYRVMASSSPPSDGSSIKAAKPITIGLNESRVGIVAPPWLARMMVDTVGRRPAELALALGTLFEPEEALEANLVDRLAPPGEVRRVANDVAVSQFLKIPPPARVASKMLMRKQRLDELVETRQQDVDHFVNFITDEGTQKNLGAYLAMLAKKAGGGGGKKKE